MTFVIHECESIYTGNPRRDFFHRFVTHCFFIQYASSSWTTVKPTVCPLRRICYMFFAKKNPIEQEFPRCFVAVWSPQPSSSFAKFAFREATTQWFSALSWSNALQWKTCSWRFGSGRRQSVIGKCWWFNVDVPFGHKWGEPDPFLGYSPENDVSQLWNLIGPIGLAPIFRFQGSDVLRNGCSSLRFRWGSTWFQGSTPWNWWFCFKEQRFGRKATPTNFWPVETWMVLVYLPTFGNNVACMHGWFGSLDYLNGSIALIEVS